MPSLIFAAALAATLTCDPSVFRTYVYPQGAVTNSVLDPRGVPGATTKAEAFSRIDANAATAMLGIRAGFIQRILWPVLNAECGGAKTFFQTGTNDLTQVDFSSDDIDAPFTCTSDMWLRPWYAASESFRNDIAVSTNRVYSSPRIVATAKNACDDIISRYLKGVAATYASDNDNNRCGYWLVPGIDHMALCDEGIADGDAGSLIDFDAGAFLPLLRCIDDVTDPSNTSRASDIGFYGNPSRFRPNIKFQDSGFTADDSNPNEELGASVSATNYPYGDLRIGPKMSDILCAAAPGLPQDATNLNAIANYADNPRILWYRFALANAILGTMTDYFVPNAIIYQLGYDDYNKWDTREYNLDGLNRVFQGTYGITRTETYNAEGFQEWTCQGTASEDSPIVIAQVYDAEEDKYYWGARFDIDQFKAGTVETNIYDQTSVETGNLENVTYGWEDSDNFLSASVIVTFNGTLSTLNDKEQDDGQFVSSADLADVPDGRYPSECFEIDSVEGATSAGRRSEGIAVKWSQTSDLVPTNFHGKILQYLKDLPNSDATATISANRGVRSSGSFFRSFMKYISPYEEPKDLLNASRYNYLPVGMFPEGSPLSHYVDFTLLSIISAKAFTNNTSFIHDHGTNGLKTTVIKTRLKKHNIVPTTKNLRDAQVNDRSVAFDLMSAASADINRWNVDDPAWQSSTDVYAMKHGVDVTSFAGETKTLFASNDVAPQVGAVIGDGNGNGGMILTVHTDDEDHKVGKWSLDSPEYPAFQIRFAVSVDKDYPLRYSTMTRFNVAHHLYMKFKFPMFDCSNAMWPAWTPNKEYEPKRPYKWESEKNDDSSSSTTQKETEQ
jgi:hypothetical protein